MTSFLVRQIGDALNFGNNPVEDIDLSRLNIRQDATYADLRGRAGGVTATSWRGSNVLGATTQGDGGEGNFVWTTDTTSADDGGTVIVPSAAPRTGAWKRVYETDLNVKWWGATGDGTTDDTTAIERAISVAQTLRRDLFFPSGTYRTTRKILINQSVRIKGVKPRTGNGIYYGVYTPSQMSGSVIYGDHYDDSIVQIHSFTGFPPGLELQQIGIVGRVYAQTYVDVDQWFPTATLTVQSTTGFTSSGRAIAGGVEFTYTGITPTSFTGVTMVGPVIGGAVLTEASVRGGVHPVVQPRPTNPTTTISGDQTFANSYFLRPTITVVSTTDFPSAGLLFIDGKHIIRYESKTTTSFVDCYMEQNGALPSNLTITNGSSVRLYEGTAGLRIGDPGGSYTAPQHHKLDDVWVANCYTGFAVCNINENHWGVLSAIGCHKGFHNQSGYVNTSSLDLTVEQLRLSACNYGHWDDGGSQNWHINNSFIDSTVRGDYTWAGTETFNTAARSRGIRFSTVYCERNSNELDNLRPDCWNAFFDSTYQNLEHWEAENWHFSNTTGRMGRPFWTRGTKVCQKTFRHASYNGATAEALDNHYLAFEHATPDGWTDHSTTEEGLLNILGLQGQERLTGLALGRELPRHVRIKAVEYLPLKGPISSASSYISFNATVPEASLGDMCWFCCTNRTENAAVFQSFIKQAEVTSANTVTMTLFDPSGAAIALQDVIIHLYILRNDRGDHTRTIAQKTSTTSVNVSTALGKANGQAYGPLAFHVLFVPDTNSNAYAAGTKLWYIDASNYCELVPASGRYNIVVDGTTYTTPTGQAFSAGDLVELYVSTRGLISGTMTTGGPYAKIRVNGGATVTLADGTGTPLKFLPPTGTLYFLANSGGTSAFTYTNLYRIDCYKPERHPL